MASEIKVDTISEKTSANGVTIDSLSIKDGGLVAAGNIDVNGNNLVLDANANTYLDAGTDDTIKVYVSGAEDLRIAANAINVLSGTTLTIDSGATITNSGTANGFGGADPSSADGDTLGTASAEWSDLYLADGGIVYFGNDQDIKLTHNADKGLILKHAATADDKPVILTLQTGETDLAADDVIGKLEFQAPDEGTGTDAILVSGAIQAVAEGNHSSSSNATSLQFMTGASEAATAKMYIKSDGKVGIGESAPFCNAGGLHIKKGDSGQSSASAGAADLVVESDGNAGLSFLSSTSGNGSIHFGDSGGDTRARIVYRHADDSMALETGHGEGNVEIFRMHNYGMLIGRTDFVSGVNAIVQVNADKKASGGGGFLAITSVTGAANLYHCHNGNGHVGGISTSGTSTSFNTTSDYRLKENETAITDGITRIKQLKPYKFNFKADADTTLDGFFAHEVSDVVPEAIMGEKDAMIPEILYTAEDELPEGKNIGDVKEATKIDPQGIDQAKLVPLLTSALQEAITKIETLEAKVTALENA